MQRIVRSVCVFAQRVTPEVLDRPHEISTRLEGRGFHVQTKRVVSPVSIVELDGVIAGEDLYFSPGTIALDDLRADFETFVKRERMCANVDLTEVEPDLSHVRFLFDLSRRAASKTFCFSFVFNNRSSSPFFPAAAYAADGFAIGLQPTNLGEGTTSLDGWLDRLSQVWRDIHAIFGQDEDFLGIDSSIAPLGGGLGSFAGLAVAEHGTFRRSVLSDYYTRVSGDLVSRNPRPTGLCGLMFPCLEDGVLAEHYELGQFDLETNLFLSLHSGLGIDTFPLGLDEDEGVVLNVLKLVRALSARYGKPLSVRFVSDGVSRIGQRTSFHNEYLCDVAVRALV